MDISFLDHTADIKFKVRGKTINEVFEGCLEAVTNYMSDNADVKNVKTKEITVDEKDLETLLYKFLEEILFLVETEDFVPSSADVEVKNGVLKAKLYGDDASKYELKQVKAATYAEMYVKKVKTGYEAQVVMDV